LLTRRPAASEKGDGRPYPDAARCRVNEVLQLAHVSMDAKSSPCQDKDGAALVVRGEDAASTVVRAVVSLGSNIEPRREYLERALTALASLPKTRIVRASSILETEPMDVPAEFAEQKFLNQAAIFETGLSPQEFSRRMHLIEDELGRVRTVRNGPRTIDIDLIDFGGIALDTPELTLPHPRAHLREFVLKPLRELGIAIENSAIGIRVRVLH